MIINIHGKPCEAYDIVCSDQEKSIYIINYLPIFVNVAPSYKKIYGENAATCDHITQVAKLEVYTFTTGVFG